MGVSMDSWAYKVDDTWTYGAVNCTDGSQTTLSSNCIYPICDTGGDISGCTDETAFNYNPNATIDDGSCVPELEGCMDEDALNYDSWMQILGAAVVVNMKVVWMNKP